MFESGESCAVAVLAEGAGGGFAVHEDVEGEAAQSGDDARVGSDPGSILGEGDVSDIVGGIFDAPVCADGLCGEGGGERGVGDVEGGIVGELEQPGFGRMESRNGFPRREPVQTFSPELLSILVQTRVPAWSSGVE